MDDATDDNSGDKLDVVRDTLVKLLCKSGKSETMEFYQILWLFNKYYNKWLPSLDDTFVSGEHGVGIKNPNVLARIMEKRESLIKEVKLEKGGKCRPHHV